MIEIRHDKIRPDNKTLYFGYGDICVGNTTFGLTFTEFEPEVEVGTVITPELEKEKSIKYISEKFIIPIKCYEEAKELGRLLDSMDGKDNFQFDFKGWRFNFSNWNPKSIESIKRHLAVVRGNLLMCCAC